MKTMRRAVILVAMLGGVMITLAASGQAQQPEKQDRTVPFAYSADEGVDVGTDNETPVTEDYREGDNRFTSKIQKVTIELK